jgi:predicted aspartyl protease
MRYQCFTGRCNGVARSLESEIRVGAPVGDRDSIRPQDAVSQAKAYSGIWDTGATGCVISQRVVDECGLDPISVAQVFTAKGETRALVYRVSLFLPNGMSFAAQRVTLGDIEGCDVLIGMDIIGRGDFAVSSDNGKTLFSFRHPSAGPIDFMSSGGAGPSSGRKVGRNDPCPCGSGRKYKKCCGRKV